MAGFTRRKMVQAIGAIMATPFISACGQSNDDSVVSLSSLIPAKPSKPISKPSAKAFFIYSNILDSRIIGGNLDSGEEYFLNGEKNASGSVVSANQFIFIDKNQDSTSLSFDAENKKIISSVDGVQIGLSRGIDGGTIFSLVVGDEQLEMNVPDSNKKMAKAFKSLQAYNEPRIGKKITLKLDNLVDDCLCTPVIKSSTMLMSKAASVIYPPVTAVNISGCAGDNPVVKVIMRDQDGKVLDVLFGKKESLGRYNIAIPYHNTGEQAYASAAEKALEYLKDAGIEGGFLNSLNNVLNPFSSLDNFVGELADGVVGYLESRQKAADLYEKFAYFLNISSEDVDDVQKKAKFSSFLGKILKPVTQAVGVFNKLLLAYQAGNVLSDFIDAYTQEQFNKIQLQPIVVTSKGEKFTGVSSGLVSPEGPYPELAVAASKDVKISSLILRPANPIERQNYTATGNISCLADGDIVALSVQGTDGYVDETLETVSGFEAKSFQLGVPGAEMGVQDKVVLVVKRGGVIIATRAASLVFS